MASRFVINKSSNDQFYFVLKAWNWEVIATSEMYTTKQNCKNWIASVKENAPKAVIVDMT